MVKPLRSSHIIPDFLLSEVEEGIPKGKSRQEQPHIRLVNFKTLEDIYCFQKETVYNKEGLKEFLLCSDCEQRLALGENYTRRVLYGKKKKKEHTRATKSKIWYKNSGGRIFQEGLEIRWVEFKHFKQFQVGLIWKMCVATGNFFKEATASEEIVENMRNSLNSGSFDEKLVPCVMERLHDPTGASLEIIGQPKRNEKIIHVMMGGYIWLYFIDGIVPSGEITLQKNGKLLIKIIDAKEL